MNLLMIIASLLGLLVVFRLMTVSQLASELSGEDEDEEQKRHNYWNGVGMVLFMVFGLGLMVYMTFKYKPFMLPEAASVHGVATDLLLNINFAVIGLVFFITQIALFWFLWKYRHDKKRFALFYPENHKLELIWTVVPTIVLAALIITGLKEWNKITNASAGTEGIHVQVYGYQFNWMTRYSGADNKLGRSYFRLISNDNPLGLDFSDPATKDDIITRGPEMHLPKGKAINFHFNSRDVIHSAYFPHLRTQMNCVPGMTTKFYVEPTITTAEMRKITKNDKFDYVLLCNKICGVAHYSMKMTLVIDEPAAFDSWLRGEKPAMEGVKMPTAEVGTEKKVPSHI